jgi:O-antigen ligase
MGESAEMKTSRFPIALLCLFVVLGLSVQPLSLSVPWGQWVVPGVAALVLLGTLSAGGIPFRVWVGAAALIGLLAFYTWNPTHRWNEGLGLLPVQNWMVGPGSASPGGTWNTGMLALSMLAAFLLAYRLSEKQVWGLQVLMMVAAAALSMVVISQRLEPNHSSVFEYTGIFVNENHFAVCMNLVLPLVLALASRARFRAVQEGRPSSPAGLYVLAALLISAAIVLSRSRAGITVMAVVVAVHVFQAHRWVIQYPFAGVPAPPFMKVIGGGIILAVVGLAVAAFAREWQQIASIQREWAFRFGMVQDTWASWQAHPWWGIGPGAFTDVFPYYQSEMFKGKEILHAHCEPVQFLAEYGVAGGAWVLGSLWLMGLARSRTWVESARLPPFSVLERPAFGLGLFAIALHSLVDFPFRIPLLAVMAAAWAGVWAGHRSAARPAWVSESASEKGAAPLSTDRIEAV